MSIPSLPNRVCWREGICVSAQHFQRQERYLESQLQARLALSLPLAWGASQLQLDATALARDSVALQSLHAILPMGSVVALSEGLSPMPAPRSIAPHFEPRAHHLMVYLALPLAQTGLASFTRPNQDKEHRVRYHVQDHEVQDEGQPDRKVRVELLQPQLRFLFEGEAQEGYECLPIARLVKNPGQGYAQDPSYIPPCVSMQAAPRLRSQLHVLLEQALSCYRELQGRRPQTKEIAARDLMIYLRMGAISAHLPALERCAKELHATPSSVHQALSAFAGQLWALFEESEPVRVPPLTHEDPGAALFPLLTMLDELLLRCVQAPRPFVEIPLTSRGQGLWGAELSDPRLAQAERFLLSLRSTLPPSKMLDLVQTQCKVAASSQIHAVVDKAVSGAQMQALSGSTGIALRPGEVLVEFDLHNGYWRDLFAERALSLHAPTQTIQPEHQPRLLALLPHTEDMANPS